ncbi:hypothetical protein ABT168_01350 [Streptomyces sp. NPDC001793]|uniref:hypothetical protein n=1 Tax=Streptomyces sp. NPDC001793 TaxID=3154657 RepID=UPI003316D0CF
MYGPAPFSAWLGVATAFPTENLHCRNLDGRTRLLREVKLSGVAVEQYVELRSHSDLPGGIMHRYGVELRIAGNPFYTGETVHGYLTPELLAEQQGLDGGRYVPPWLDRQTPAPTNAQRLNLSADTRWGHGRLALLEDVTLVPGGGDHGAGYLLCEKPVRPDDWFFDQHFLRDPVMPGSTGVQMLYHAVHAYALYSGLAADLPEPRCTLTVGEELHWSYRGQILREHRRVRGEVHIRTVRRTDQGIRLQSAPPTMHPRPAAASPSWRPSHHSPQNASVLRTSAATTQCATPIWPARWPTASLAKHWSSPCPGPATSRPSARRVCRRSTSTGRWNACGIPWDRRTPPTRATSSTTRSPPTRSTPASKPACATRWDAWRHPPSSN